MEPTLHRALAAAIRAGGGIGVLGSGSSGAGGAFGVSGNGVGGGGAVRIIYGTGRAYPSTGVADV